MNAIMLSSGIFQFTLLMQHLYLDASKKCELTPAFK